MIKPIKIFNNHHVPNYPLKKSCDLHVINRIVYLTEFLDGSASLVRKKVEVQKQNFEKVQVLWNSLPY